MDILTPEQKRVLELRGRFGTMLKHLGLNRSQRKEWLDRHEHLPAEEIAVALRNEFGKGTGCSIAVPKD